MKHQFFIISVFLLQTSVYYCSAATTNASATAAAQQHQMTRINRQPSFSVGDVPQEFTSLTTTIASDDEDEDTFSPQILSLSTVSTTTGFRSITPAFTPKTNP